MILDPGCSPIPPPSTAPTPILIAHEHPDHYLADNLRRPPTPVFPPIEAVAAKIREDAPEVAERLHGRRPDRRSTSAAGARGRRAARRDPPGFPRITNSGYVVDAGGTRVYHPGDALTEARQTVDVLLCPVSAPWMKASEAIEFARGPRPRNLAIHDPGLQRRRPGHRRQPT